MAFSYTRQSAAGIATSETITAALFNNEYNEIFNAFAYSNSNEAATGHRHDGSSAQGGSIYVIGDMDFLNKIEADSSNNRWGFSVEVAAASVEQVRIQDGGIVPVTTNDIDLGAAGAEFKDLYIDGTAYIDALDFGGVSILSVLDEDTMSSDSATALATQQSIKAYVDATATAAELSFTADSGGIISHDLDGTPDFDIEGGAGIDTTASADKVTVAVDSTVLINGGALGTPSSGVATNLTGTAAGLTAGNVTTNANLTGHVTSTGNAAILGSFTAAQLNTAVNDDTVVIEGATSTASMSFVLDEDTMSSDSATKLATQQSIKAYVDVAIAEINRLKRLKIFAPDSRVDTTNPGTLEVINGQTVHTLDVGDIAHFGDGYIPLDALTEARLDVTLQMDTSVASKNIKLTVAFYNAADTLIRSTVYDDQSVPNDTSETTISLATVFNNTDIATATEGRYEITYAAATTAPHSGDVQLKYAEIVYV